MAGAACAGLWAGLCCIELPATLPLYRAVAKSVAAHKAATRAALAVSRRAPASVSQCLSALQTAAYSVPPLLLIKASLEVSGALGVDFHRWRSPAAAGTARACMGIMQAAAAGASCTGRVDASRLLSSLGCACMLRRPSCCAGVRRGLHST